MANLLFEDGVEIVEFLAEPNTLFEQALEKFQESFSAVDECKHAGDFIKTLRASHSKFLNALWTISPTPKVETENARSVPPWNTIASRLADDKVGCAGAKEITYYLQLDIEIKEATEYLFGYYCQLLHLPKAVADEVALYHQARRDSITKCLDPDNESAFLYDILITAWLDQTDKFFINCVELIDNSAPFVQFLDKIREAFASLRRQFEVLDLAKPTRIVQEEASSFDVE